VTVYYSGSGNTAPNVYRKHVVFKTFSCFDSCKFILPTIISSTLACVNCKGRKARCAHAWQEQDETMQSTTRLNIKVKSAV